VPTFDRRALEDEMRQMRGSLSITIAIVAVTGCASGDGNSTDDGGVSDAHSDVHVPECVSNEDCDDGLECTVGTCDEGTCVVESQDDLCEDGAGCIVGRCNAGVCGLEGDDDLCDDGNECTVNTCDATGGCQMVDAADGTACLYGLWTCEMGVCDGNEAAGKSVFRANTVTLEDPAVHASSGSLCLPAASVTNSLLETSIDGLDLNFVFTFDPLAMPEDPNTPVQLWMADCHDNDGAGPISCTAPGDQDPLSTSATFQTSGTCLEAQEGTVHFGDPNTAVAPCWVTEPTTFLVDLEGILIPLQDARAGATMLDGDTMVNGLIFGFLDEDTAMDVMLPDDFPLVGGEPLSSLLPPLSCDDTEARNTHNGERGWWFHLNFTAERLIDHSGF
jgi:hypothetical protein